MPNQITGRVAVALSRLIAAGRSTLLACALVPVLGTVLTDTGTAQTADPNSDGWCAISGDTVLTNGRFLTVDPDDSIQSAVRIRGDRIVASVTSRQYDCDRVVDLGRRRSPGFINNHLQFPARRHQPGHDIGPSKPPRPSPKRRPSLRRARRTCRRQPTNSTAPTSYRSSIPGARGSSPNNAARRWRNWTRRRRITPCT